MSDADGRDQRGDRSWGTARLRERRSQLVLVAAGVIAIGLLPVVLAYTQLGYAGMAASEPTATTETDDALRSIERAAFAASQEVQASGPWTERAAVAGTVATRFDRRVASIERGGIERGVVHEVERNATAASAWANEHCPDGSSRQFGPCEAQDGTVLQERGGDTHVLAIVVDLRTVTEGTTYDGTYVLDAETGV